MKRLLIIAICAVMCCELSAQSLKIGSKAPKTDPFVWLTPPPVEKKRTTLVEFFHSSNKSCTDRIELLEQLATQHADSLNVIVVVRGDDTRGHQMLADGSQHFYVAQLSPRAMRGIGVRYVPYAYVTCPKRRTLWCGNPVFLEHETLKILISDGKYHDRPLRKAASGRTRR